MQGNKDANRADADGKYDAEPISTMTKLGTFLWFAARLMLLKPCRKLPERTEIEPRGWVHVPSSNVDQRSEPGR